MRICSIKGCKKKHSLKGYCNTHYQAIIRRSLTPNIYGECSIKNCGRGLYAKGYCWKHYAFFKRESHKKKCEVKNCNNNCFPDQKYCFRHRDRIKRNLPLDLSIKTTPKGERNVNWKGGIAEYPNHYLMKKNRLIILMQNPKCERCGKPATQIHHKDFTKTNHKLNNLVAICHKCNVRLSSKFYQRYGLTLDEITEQLGMSRTYWWKHQNKLKKVLFDNKSKSDKIKIMKTNTKKGY